MRRHGRSGAGTRGPMRDRRGRGLRGELTPRAVPRSRTRGEQFDDLVLDAVEELEVRWGDELAGVEFAIEEVPVLAHGAQPDFDPDVIADRGVPLGRLMRAGIPGTPSPTIVLYRRPVEARAHDGMDRADLVFMIVTELVAEFLGRDIDEIDPPR
jgi:hypothetical protein